MALAEEIAPQIIATGSHSVDIGSGANRIIVISGAKDGSNPTAPTIAGNSATQALMFVATTSGDRRVGMWYYFPGALSGTQTIVADGAIYLTVLTGSVQSSPIDDFNTNTNSSGTSHNVGLSITASNCWVFGAGNGSQNINSVSGILSTLLGAGGCLASSNGTVGTGSQTGTFATNSGTFGFGLIAIKPLTTTAPTVDTTAVDDIAQTTATLNANITDDGGASLDERGFVWGTTSHSDPGNVAPASTSYDDYDADSGSFSEGVFDFPATGLVAETTYYVRGYAHNSVGYSYGDEVSFETLPIPYGISGVVTLSAVPVEGAIVRCIRQSDNVVETEQTTDASGVYAFADLDVAELYHLAVEYEDVNGKYNALSLWDVVPVEVV